MKVTTIKKLESICKDYYKDEDGYWYILNNNWEMDDYYSNKTIHENTKKEVLNTIKNINFRFTLSRG